MGLFEETLAEAGTLLEANKKKSPVQAQGSVANEVMSDYGRSIADIEANPSFAGAMGRSFKASAIYEFPKQVQGAVAATGRALQDTGVAPDVGRIIEQAGVQGKESVAAMEYGDPSSRPVYNPETDPVKSAFEQGARMAVPSIIPAAGFAINPAAGAALTTALFGGSQSQDTYENVRDALIAKGVPAEEAHARATAAGYKSGAIEAGGEIVGGLVLSGLFTAGGRLGRQLLKGASKVKTGEDVLKAIANPRMVKEFGKNIAEALITEPATEFGQSAGERAVEASEGVPGESPLAAGKAAIGPAAAMALLFAPIGAMGHYAAHKQIQKLRDTLADPTKSIDDRISASEAVAEQIQPVNAEQARNWRENTAFAIDRDQPVTLTPDFLQDVQHRINREQGFAMGDSYDQPVSSPVDYTGQTGGLPATMGDIGRAYGPGDPNYEVLGGMPQDGLRQAGIEAPPSLPALPAPAVSDFTLQGEPYTGATFDLQGRPYSPEAARSTDQPVLPGVPGSPMLPAPIARMAQEPVAVSPPSITEMINLIRTAKKEQSFVPTAPAQETPRTVLPSLGRPAPVLDIAPDLPAIVPQVAPEPRQTMESLRPSEPVLNLSKIQSIADLPTPQSEASAKTEVPSVPDLRTSEPTINQIGRETIEKQKGVAAEAQQTQESVKKIQSITTNTSRLLKAGNYMVAMQPKSEKGEANLHKKGYRPYTWDEATDSLVEHASGVWAKKPAEKKAPKPKPAPAPAPEGGRGVADTKRGTVIKPGDEFVFKGRSYGLTRADVGDSVTAMDLSGPYPIARAWGSTEDFEKQTGLKVHREADDSNDDTSVFKKPVAEVKEVPGGLLVKKLPDVSKNTIFTDDAYAKAKALLRSKMSQVNVGIDPDIMQAGFTMAGYHIEKGARTFAAYAKAMVADLGDGVKPYLKSFYNGVRDLPGIEHITKEMDSHGQVANTDIETALKSGIIEPKEQANDNSRDSGAGPGALESKLPGNVQPDGEERRPAEGKRGSSKADATRDAGPDKGGSVTGNSLGGSTGVVRPDGSGQGLPAVENPAPVTEPRPLNRTGANPGNYQITEADIIGKGTRGNRIDNNLAAIRIVKTLDKENRFPTKEEQSILARYVGWGGLKNVFDESSDKPQDRRAFSELKSLLTENEFFEARQSIQDAHYTERGIIESMFDILQHLGIKGGHFLEPTYGVGLFPGLMPAEMSDSSKWYGSEMDIISAKIGQYLFPRAQFINSPFQEAEFPYEKFDVAIGNPPFGDWRITDTNKRRSEIAGMKIHNYIIGKSGMHVKPGGVMAFVVTQRFLDTADPEVRNYLAKNFNFLGAIRLPNTAFKENAGTDVTTDIVLFQKFMPGEDTSKAYKGWLETNATMTNERGEEVTLNKYFAKRPENMLGIPSMNGKMWRKSDGKSFTLEPREGLDIRQAIKSLLETELSNLKDVANQNAKDLADALAMSVDLNKEGIGIGGYFLDGKDAIYTRLDDDAQGNPVYEKISAETQWTEKTKLGLTRYMRIKGMLELRAKAYELIRAERFDMPGIEDLRKELNKLYDRFVDKYGYISDTANMSLISEDAKIETGLEAKYQKAISASKAETLGVKQSPAKADKATLLKERVYFPTKEILHADSARGGYGISLSEKGKLDIAYIAGLTNKTEEQVTKELSDEGLIFKEPGSDKWIQEDEYLSGNVKQKLKDAEEGGTEYEKNVTALKKVQPKDVATEEVFVDMGATWIPRETYQEYAEALGIKGARVLVVPETGRVSISHYDSISENELNIPLKNDDFSIADVFNKVANHQALVAYDRTDDDKRVVNRDRTKALIPIGKKIAQTFKDWIFADPSRSEKLTKIYNDTQNTHAKRQFDGSHLKTVGANPSVDLYSTQRSGAWRMIQSPVVLLDHVVGAGKTMTIITGVQERKRMGISQKPVIIVPNHIVGQWARDYAKLYPAANVLAASEKDFSAPNRKRLLARMATGKYDSMIIGHSSLSFIPLERETQAKFVREEMAHLEKALKDAEAADDKRTVRSLTNRIEKKREKIKKLMDMPKNDVATWESMGIDYVVVDESQEFKNLEYSTFMQSMAGMGTPTGSLKAFDLYAKLRYTREKQGGITFATGTPISNSLVEMYSLLRYLNKEEMDKRGLGAFDAWAKAYAGIENRIEYTATQKLKDRLVMTSFNNMPELKQLYLEFADVVSREDLKRLYSEQMEAWNKAHPEDKRTTRFPEPKIKGGQRQLDVDDSLPSQKEFMDYLVARAEILEKNSDPEYKKIDNHLWVMNDARKMALDVRLVDPKADPGKNNKIDRTARNVKRLYDKWNADKGTQLVFCDLSTPLAQAEKEANKFIIGALKRAGLDKDATTKRRLESMTGGEKWDYIRHQIQQQIERLSASEDEADMKRRESLEEYLLGISDEDAAALTTADTKFSVYDELKATLVRMGIPEGEVKFIHEANTKDKKEELFGLVNSGQVRVLIGSSKKMGAGTNVQERLVGLHHMDAPWRPSDVEQREGRIIRQGNALYERDPDGFEVEILSYSTRNTFDSVMWQILARKAEMIESLKSDERTVKDQSSDSASYADFMAESTGSPAFKEKYRLEQEIEELESVERRINARRASAEGTSKNAASLIKNAEERLADRQDGMKRAEAAKDFVYDGKAYPDDLADGFAASREEWAAESAQYEEELKAHEEWESGLPAKDVEDGKAAIAAYKAEHPEPKKPKVPVGKDALSRLKKHSKIGALIYDIKNYLDGAPNGAYAEIAFGDVPIKILKEESWRGEGDQSNYHTFIDGIDNESHGGKEASYDQILRALSSAYIQKSLQGRVRGAETDLESTQRNIESAKLTLSKVRFEDAEKLAQKRTRYAEVVKEVAALEEQVSKDRENKENRYIKKDTARFGAKYSLSDSAIMGGRGGANAGDKPSSTVNEGSPETRTLERHLRAQTRNDSVTVRVYNPETPESEDIAKFASAFGKKVVYVKATGLAFNGAVLPSDPSTIYINVATREPHLAVFGHELVHTLRSDNPELYQKFSDLMDTLIQDEDLYRDRLNALREAAGLSPANAAAAREDLLGDFIGNRITNRAFMTELQQKAPTVFDRIASILRSLVAKITSVFKKDLPKFFKDLQKADAISTDILSVYAKSKGAASIRDAVFENGEFRPDIKFSLGEVEKAKNDGEALPHLTVIGRGVIESGARTYTDFAQGMKKVLGKLWDAFKHLMLKVYGLAKAAPARDAQKADSSVSTSSPEHLTTAKEKLRLEDNEDLSAHLLATRKSRVWDDIKKGTDRIAGVISTRLKNIHPTIKDAARRYVYNVGQQMSRDNFAAYPFVEKFSKLDDQTKINLSRALLNADKETADRVAAAHGLTAEVQRAREIFFQARERATKAGFDVGQIRNYWARVVKDPEGLLNDLRDTEEWSAIDAAIRVAERERGTSRGLSDEEKATIADLIMRGYPAGSLPLSGTSHMKDRKFKTIPDKYLKYYMSADQSLISYIRSMNNAIEAARFFGKGKNKNTEQGSMAKSAIAIMNGGNPELLTDGDISKSIGDYIIELKNEGKLRGRDELPLKEMLQAIFKPGRTGQGVQMYKNLTYLQLLTQFTPAITQIMDIALTAEQVGYWNTLKVLGKTVAGKSDVKLADIGLERIIEEMDGGIGAIAHGLEKAMKITGFTAIDRIGKETLLSGKLLQFQQQARRGDAKLSALVERVFGKDEASRVMTALKAGEKSDDTLFLLYNALSDVQPISRIEVPEKYLSSGAGKVFYALKTYQLKLLDVYRNEVWHEIKNGNKIEGYKKLAFLTGALMFLGAGTDELKDWLLGRKTNFSDLVIDNFLRLGGFSKYTISRAREEGIGQSILAQFAPPFGIVDPLTKDIDELVRKGQLEKGARFTAYVPVVGKSYYWWFGRGKNLKAEQAEKQAKIDRERRRLGDTRYEQKQDMESQRRQAMSDLHKAKTPDEIREARMNAIRFNAKLRQSPAFSVVNIISADTIRQRTAG